MTYKITISESKPPTDDNKYASERPLLTADVDTIKQIKDLVAALHE
jgi:hypothetical protein